MKYRIVEYPGCGFRVQQQIGAFWLDTHPYYIREFLDAKYALNNIKFSPLQPKVVHEEEGW